jgi:predicted DNA-binding protein (UPF0251 family)
MARPQKCRCICSMPQITEFGPRGRGACARETVVLGVDEYEVIRLLDYAHLTQAQCAERMNIARTTVTRMCDIAHEKLADALINGKNLVISGGEVMICTGLRPECSGIQHCCHRKPFDGEATAPGAIEE